MIIDALNINETELSSIKSNSKVTAPTPLNTGSNRIEQNSNSGDSINTFSEDIAEGSNQRSFLKHLEEASNIKVLSLNESIPENKPKDGNSLPLNGDTAILLEGDLIQNIDSLPTLDTDAVIEVKQDLIKDSILSNLKNDDIDSKSKSIKGSNENELLKGMNKDSIDLVIQDDLLEKPINFEQKNLQNNVYLSNEKLVNLNNLKTKNNLPSNNRLILSNLDKQPQLAISENLITQEDIEFSPKLDANKFGKIMLNQPLEEELLNSSKIVKESLKGISFENNLINSTQGSSISKLSSIFEHSQISTNETVLPVVNSSYLKPVIEQSLSPEQVIFKQPLSANGQFSNGLGIRIQWMLQQAVSSAEVMLDPPELGPLNVKLVQTGHETNIVFQVQTPQGKDAIEDNLAKLKEMLQSQGLSLGETEIEQKQQDEASEEDRQQELANQASDLESEEQNENQERSKISSKLSLLDTYI